MAVAAEPDLSDRPSLVEDSGAYSGSASHAAPTNRRLIIASSVRLMREGMAATLDGCGGVVVADVVDLSPAGIARIAAAEPDIVLVDVGEGNPITLARLIKAASPGAKLVAFPLDEIDERVFACAAAGFSGYVPRDGGPDELHRALVDTMEGRMHCAPHITAAIFNRLAGFLQEAELREAPPSLTLREQQVLALVQQGRSNKDIARQLAISSATVKNHMHNILQKLQVNRRGQAAAAYPLR
jgi:two-component system, NarL family, nitrate/nitrite response regulator NarL